MRRTGIGGSAPFYTKVMDSISIDTFIVNNVGIDIGMLPKERKGLLGLDILKFYNFIIDLDKLTLYQKEKRSG